MNIQELVDPENRTNHYLQMKVSIGGNGKIFNGANPQFDFMGSYQMGPNLVLQLPDSVAEYFRQQGRRQLQAEFRRFMNVGKA